MAGEGFTAHMIASLKNNKRSRTGAFNKLKKIKKSKLSKLHFPKKATPEELKRIRKKIQRENNIIFYRKVSIIMILILVIIYAIGFVE